MQTIKDHKQPRAEGGSQKVLLDPAITAETDELDLKFEEGKGGKTENENPPIPKTNTPWNSSE